MTAQLFLISLVIWLLYVRVVFRLLSVVVLSWKSLLTLARKNSNAVKDLQ